MDLLKSILDQMEDAFIISDKNNVILFFNEAALNLSESVFGKPIQQGQNLMAITSSVRGAFTRNILEEIYSNKQPQKSFAEYPNRQGTTSYLEYRYTPVLDEKGQVAYIHAFIRDITPQKVFEKKMTTLVANTSNLIEKANAMIIGMDTRGYITDWNEYCTRTTGFEKNEVFTQRLEDILLSNEEKQRFEGMMAHVLIGQEVSNFEISTFTKTGKQVVLMLNCTMRISATGKIIGITLVGQDVTELTEYRRSLERKVEERTRELKRALQKEKEVVEMKSRFVSIASHEFRTPLSSIQFATNFIKKNNLKITPDDLREKLSGIEKQIHHMTHLLDDVLTYSKSQAGKIQLVESEVGLNNFINKIIEDVGHNTRNTHAIKLELGELPEAITTDEKLLRSILINLLTNAIKFSPGCDHVALGIHQAGDKLIFIVHDNGIGISGDEVQKIFEPFLRGKNASPIQGTGLGLSIVKKAVELLNGTIELESEPGRGSTFIVAIPIA